MKAINKILSAAVAAAAVSGGLLLGASPAAAATAPAWEPDPNGNGGTLSFYDAAGHQVSGGTNLTHLFDYAAASTAEDSGAFHKATLAFAYPNHSLPTSSWFVNGGTAATSYPVASAQNDLATVPADHPVAHPGTTEMNLSASLGGATLDTTAGYANIVQIRLQQSGSSASYYTADISYDLAAGTWQQVYPDLPAANATTTTLSVGPSSPQDAGTNVTLTAHVAASPSAPTNGSVQFYDGATKIDEEPFSGSDVSFSTSSLSIGTHQLTAKYVASGIAFAGSTSAATAYVIKQVVVATTTSLSVNPGTGKAFAPVQLTATVAPSAAPGKVTFTDSVAGNLGTTAAGSGTFTLTTSALAQGDHTITATFVPTDPTAYSGSNNTAAPFTLAAPDCATCTSPASFDVNVNPGTLTISTPYDGSSAAKTFHMGDLVLDANGTKLTALGHFGTAANPSAGVTITDTRAGDQQWTASVSATDFVKGTDSIDTTQLGFVGVNPSYLSGNALNAATKPVVTNDVPEGTPGVKGGPHQFATAAHGVGTVYVYGDFTLTAPTSTVAGLYTATVTFTIA